MARDALVVTGATATGKTTLALLVAERLDGEIISMDSRQVYRGMEIGTAKATPEQRSRIPHHGLDLVDPGERYSAGRFARDARRWIAAVRARGRVPILVGGTGFFLRSLTHPLFAEPPMPEDRRDRLRTVLSGWSRDELQRWIGVLDPETAEALSDRGGTQRVARAIEVALLSGAPLSAWHRSAPPEAMPLNPLVFVLELPRDALYRRIDARVREMVEQGLPDEVRELLEAGFEPGAPGLDATGYAELIPYLRGECSLDDAVDAIQRATRRYARRQITWFRHQLPADARRLDATLPVASLADRIADAWMECDR